MCKKENILPGRDAEDIYPARQDKSARASRYNNTVMKTKTVLIKGGFTRRLTDLRMQRGLSARELSLSLGQGAGYINNIENGNNLPSMGMFFEICESLNVSPKEFFAYGDSDLKTEDLLMMEVRRLPEEEKELLLKLARKLGKEKG